MDRRQLWAISGAAVVACLFAFRFGRVSAIGSVSPTPFQETVEDHTSMASIPSAAERLQKEPEYADYDSRTRTAPAAGRAVRIRGRVVVATRPTGAPAAQTSGPQPLDPTTLGIENDEKLASLRIQIAENGASAGVSEAGSFLVETEVPARMRTLTLRCESDLLLPENGNRDARIQLGDGPSPTEIDVELRMIPAVNVQPTFNGKLIRPADLADPVVRDEFLRQTSEVVSRILKAPPSDLPLADNVFAGS
jgi:hypothetical protein